MDFCLVIPFRSPFNVNTDHQLANPALYERKKYERPPTLSEEIWGLINWSSRENDDRGILRYETVSNDSSSANNYYEFKLESSAVLLEILRNSLGKVNDDLSHKDENYSPFLFIEPVSIDVNVCNNTIAILRVGLRLPIIREREIVNSILNNLDRWSNELAKIITSQIYNHFLVPIAKAYSDDCPSLFLSPRQSMSFFDADLIFTAKTYIEPPALVLWVSRIAFLEKRHSSDLDNISQWCGDYQRASDFFSDMGSREPHYSFGWGNNLFEGTLSSNHFNSLIDIFERVQYVYAILDVLNRNLQKAHAEAGYYENKRTFNSRRLNSRISRITSFVALLLAQIDDYSTYFQGERRKFYENLSSIYALQGLTESVNRKCRIVRDRLNEINSRRVVKYQRGIESVLAFIGAIAIVDFLLNLISFSKDGYAGNDNFWGPTDIVLLLPVDFILWFSIISAVAIGMGFYWGRSNG